MEPDCLSSSVFAVSQIGLNNSLFSSHAIPVLVMYFSSTATGHVMLPICAITTYFIPFSQLVHLTVGQVYNDHTFMLCNIAWSDVDKLIKAQESSIS